MESGRYKVMDFKQNVFWNTFWNLSRMQSIFFSAKESNQQQIKYMSTAVWGWNSIFPSLKFYNTFYMTKKVKKKPTQLNTQCLQ